jgi:hypothetical protein
MGKDIVPDKIVQGGFSTLLWRSTIFLSPLLYAVSPLLYSYTLNSTDYTLTDLLISSTYFILAAAVVFTLIALALLIFQNQHSPAGKLEQASLFTIFFLLLFYVLYGPAKQLLKYLIGFGFQFSVNNKALMIIGANKILFPVCLGILAVSIIYIIRHKKLVRPLHLFFQMTGIVLVTISIIHNGLLFDGRNGSTSKLLPAQNTGPNPNIYYIILDAYSGFDVLKKYYDYNNDDFARYLTDKGFYVARKSRCNYPVTILSLSSSLNMEYIPSWQNVLTSKHLSLKQYNKTRESKVAAILLQHGYTYLPIGYMFFQEGFGKKKNIVSVISYPETRYLWFNQLTLTPFESLLTSWTSFPRERQRRHILFELNLLDKSADYPGPKFVFAHITCPHPPYVFHRDGSFFNDIVPGADTMSKKEIITFRKNRYVEQLVFVTQRIKQIIDHILIKDTSAIIILQSDHGAWLIDTLKQPHDYANDSNFIAQRMPILNAYRVPGETIKSLYDSISPINSFRIVFDKLFKWHEGTIPDSHYVVYWNNIPVIGNIIDK